MGGAAASMAPVRRSQQGDCGAGGGEVGSGSAGGTGRASLTGMTMAVAVVPCLSAALPSYAHVPQPQPSAEAQGGRQLSTDSPGSDSPADGCQPKETVAAPPPPSHKRQRPSSPDGS